MQKVSIRFIVIALFLFLAFSVLGIMYFTQYKFIETMSEQSTDSHFKLLTSKLDIKLKNLDKFNTMLIEMFASEVKSKSITDIQNERKKYLKNYTIFLNTYKDMYAVHIGNSDDYFFEVINLSTSRMLLKKYNATLKDKWLIIEMNKKKGYQVFRFFDNELNQTKTKTIKTDYEPSKRPWFKLAVKANGAIKKSDPYMFGSVQTMGITYTKLVGKDMVVSIDMLIKNINEILIEDENIKHISSYIINKDYDVIASSSEKDSSIASKIIKDMRYYKNYPLKNIKVINGKKYIYYAKDMGDDILISFANLDNISESYRDGFYGLSLFTIIIAIILMPLVWYMASFVVKPILHLVEESKKIGEQEFDDIKRVNSRISEIYQLSDSIYEMAKSIKNNKKELEDKVEERTKELRKLSITDKLTGVYNRLKIDESLEMEALRYNRYEHPFGIIMMDIDYFKKVNDTYGHQMGDQVLVEFADILRKNVRECDILGRWGGEEFLIICAEIDLKNLAIFAQKLKQEVEGFRFSNDEQKTASFGIAVYEKNEKIERFIGRVDKALYRAKENGRNRIEIG